MIISVASGKGGTGKTTVAVNMAAMLSRGGSDVVYADCDVEEPNGHIFIKPVISASRNSTMPYPVVDESICTGCGLCHDICRFNAIVLISGKPIVFPDLCHACGGCLHVCPVGAIHEERRDIGVVEWGTGEGIAFIHGRLTIGQVLSPPLIRDVRRSVPEADITIVDCPPGTSCPVIASMSGADYILLVTEPTPFGLHDLKLAVEAAQVLGIPSGVVINRDSAGSSETESYCRSRGVSVLGRIPDDECIARVYSRGKLIVDELPEYGDMFLRLHKAIVRELKGRVGSAR